MINTDIGSVVSFYNVDISMCAFYTPTNTDKCATIKYSCNQWPSRKKLKKAARENKAIAMESDQSHPVPQGFVFNEYLLL